VKLLSFSAAFSPSACSDSEQKVQSVRPELEHLYDRARMAAATVLIVMRGNVHL